VRFLLTVYGDGSQTRSICHVSDLVRGIYALMRSDITTPTNIGNPTELNMLELARKIVALSDSNSEIAFCPLPEDDPKVRLPDIAKARSLLGWEPQITPDDGLRRTIEWFRREMPETKTR
jgi:dTDP-glucose 4,6-dehydratase